MTTPQRRDEPWFAALYTAHHRDIVRYGLRRVGDAELAEELAQEVFVIAWRRRRGVPDAGLPWLYGVARRVLANSRRGHRTESLADPDRVPSGPGGVDGVAGALDLRAALATLPEPDQEILRLIGWEQLTVVEAAVVLGCRPAAARVRLHRARRRLRAALADPIRPGSTRSGPTRSGPTRPGPDTGPKPAAPPRPVPVPQWRS